MRDAMENAVIDKYLSSSDFNGLYVHVLSENDEKETKQLIEDGAIEVVTVNDYMNPHIRPWSPQTSRKEQVEAIEDLSKQEYGVCLYPTRQAMASIPLGEKYEERPYSKSMARGSGTLDVVYFRMDVLEGYRNDPRFSFIFDDFGVDTSVTEETYNNEGGDSPDAIIMRHIGYAYDLSNYDAENPESSSINRYACAFVGDLAKLTPEHQMQWKAREVKDVHGIYPHPAWWKARMGYWEDNVGPFERIVFELRSINKLSINIYGQPLFKVTDRPRDFGWILRASKKDFDDFVLIFDKMLSDNLIAKTLTTMGVDTKNEDGNPLGTLKRLELFLISKGNDAEACQQLLRPLIQVRKLRQRPAHSIAENITDGRLIDKQIRLLHEVIETLSDLRKFWQKHPSNASWTEPDYIKTGTTYLM